MKIIANYDTPKLYFTASISLSSKLPKEVHELILKNRNFLSGKYEIRSELDKPGTSVFFSLYDKSGKVKTRIDSDKFLIADDTVAQIGEFITELADKYRSKLSGPYTLVT